MGIARTVAKNNLVLGASHLASKFIYLILLINITKYLGDSGFGRFSFAMAFTGLFMYAADMGLAAVTTRDVARKHSLASKYLGSVMTIKALTSIATLVLIFILSFTLGKSPEVTKAIWIFGISVVFQSYQVVFLSVFRALQKMEYDALTLMIDRIVVVSLGVAALSMGLGMISLAWIFVIGNIIANIVMGSILIFKFVKPKFSIDLNFWKYLFKESWPFSLLGTFGLIYYQIGVVLLGLFWPDDIVGLYSAGMQLVNALLFISFVFNLSLFPLMSKFYINAKDALKRTSEIAVKFMSVLGFPIAVGATILGKNIMYLIYSKEFLPGVPSMIILSWALVFTFMRSVFFNILNTSNRQRTSLWITGFATGLTVILSLALIPSIGAIGAALAVLISELIGFLIYHHVTRKELFKISLFSIFWRPILSSLIMGFAIWFIHDWSILISIPFGVVIYLLALVSMGFLSKRDITLIKEIMGLNSSTSSAQ